MTAKIKVQNLTKSFGSLHVLKGVNFEVKKGESLVIVGGSGSGKSVMLKCMLGLLQQDRGSIAIDGKDMKNFTKNEREALLSKFGMLFQGGALFDSLPIFFVVFPE
mgnify:CR=1 FL=1